MAKTIEVLITPDGETTIATKGFKGAACKKATEELERALGSVKADTATPEMNEREVNVNVDAGR